MGMFAVVKVDNSIDLPHFPEEIDRTDMTWQSKQGLDVYGGPYRITADGRLEEQKTSYRDKTDEEKQAEAEKWGFDSWDEYTQVYDESTDALVPDEVDWDIDDDDAFDGKTPPTLYPSEEIIDDQWWADISHHGTFEFHQSLKRDPTGTEVLEKPGGDIERPTDHALNVFLEYEARFDEGDLTDIVFMGQRGFNNSDKGPIEAALDEIEAWREWKEENDG